MGKAKLNIPMCAALVLLLLTMISVHLTSGLYARYTTTATGSDSARVAKFKVECTVAENITDDKEGTFTVTVQNLSEVAIEYDILVNSDRLTAKIGGNDPTSTEDNLMTFKNSTWCLGPGQTEKVHTLELSVSNWVGLTDRENDKGETEPVQVKFDVHVVARQVD